ncbi:MAG: imidazole glycerol phosphate synthase subunit HisH [Cyclobacteriaceae bacterium]|nr:imidazole glycerol phosphate synthase subunit HisH [Cyclobacteriaceae bacterium]
MIAIIDYGMGNLGSITNMFRFLGIDSMITSDPNEILRAPKILLPGVGAFGTAMKKIDERNLRSVLDQKALKEKAPILGICLGMQLLMEGSEEASEPGLGWLKGKALKFPNSPGLKVPHMGWNTVQLPRTSALTADLGEEPRFYFVHSYYVTCTNPSESILKTSFGIEFDSGCNRENIFGVQFHPEKSHKYGMKLLQNFAKL